MSFRKNWVSAFSTTTAIVALISVATVASAQRSPDGDWRRDGRWEREHRRDRAEWRVVDLAARVERTSNDLRQSFERFVREDRGSRFARDTQDAKVEMQRMDEALERMRRQVEHREWREAYESIRDASRHSNAFNDFFNIRERNWGSRGWVVDHHASWHDFRDDLDSLRDRLRMMR